MHPSAEIRYPLYGISNQTTNPRFILHRPTVRNANEILTYHKIEIDALQNRDVVANVLAVISVTFHKNSGDSIKWRHFQIFSCALNYSFSGYTPQLSSKFPI